MDHTLADEMGGRYAIDAARVHHFLFMIVSELAKLHDRGVIHPSVQPANVRIDGWRIELLGIDGPVSRVAPYATPETIATGRVSAGDNFYSVAIILRELVAGRSALEMTAVRVIERCAERSVAAKEMLGLVEALNWRTGNLPEWREAFEPHDAKEAELLSALERDPRDAALKQVYADWLEQNGHDARAAFLRSDAVTLNVDVPWRARFVPAQIANCDHARCPRSWDKLRPGAFDNQRHCATCVRDVVYCADHADAFAQIKRSERVAVDPALPVSVVLSARQPFVPMPANPPIPMATWNPPPPQPPKDPREAVPKSIAADPPRRRWFEFWKKP